MNKLVWSPKFRKSAEKFIKKNPDLIELFKTKIKMIEENAFTSPLKTHKLKGRLSSCFVSISLKVYHLFR